MGLTQIHEEIATAIRLYESIIKHGATRTREMIDRYGEVEALSRLMISPDLQTGFKVLRDRNQLELTFESIVVRNSEMFNATAVEAAKWRLSNPYDLL